MTVDPDAHDLGDAAARPSRTSQAVAVTRAEFDRSHTPEGDADAQRSLCAGMTAPVLTDRILSLRARTRFFDEAVLDGIGRGIDQVVILGAGYDDRALRFRTRGVHFIEIDHPATQSDKARRLHTRTGTGTDPVLVPGDFTRDDIAVVLQRAGHDARRRSLFLAEGLLVYLDRSTISRLLSGARARAAAGSRLAVSLAVRATGVDPARVLAAANAGRRVADREPWLTLLPVDERLDLLTRAGWRIERTVDQADLEPAAPAGRSLLVTGVADASGASPA